MQMAHSVMTMTLVPRWLAVAWAIVFAAIFVVHIGHARNVRGQARWWHASHVVMATAMATMYLEPQGGHAELYSAGIAPFAALAVALVGAALYFGSRERVINPLWVVSAIDMAAMVVMLVPMNERSAAVSYGLVAYFAVQALAWSTGVYDRIPAVVRTRVSMLATEPAMPATTTGATVGFTAHATVTMRVTLAGMAAGMGYMLLAMAA